MFVNSNLHISRRSFLLAGGGLAAAGLLRSWPVRSADIQELRIAAVPARAPLTGETHPDTEVWAYDAKVPGPVLRLRQGDPVRIVVENQLTQETTVHWHGIRLPIAMDGVPGLSQVPIKPAERFAYEFTPPDAGTFWYHPHANSLEQLGRGLAGVLIVDERDPVPVDRDILWMLSDWRLTTDGQIAAGFGNHMEAAMSGRVGNMVTLNGTVPTGERVRAGERVRLRLVNGSLARLMALRFEGHRPVVVAVDGQPCDPHEPDDGRVLLGPAMRVDVMLVMQGEPGRSYAVTDDFYDGLGYTLTRLNYAEGAPVRATPLDIAFRLPPNPLPEPDLATAERHEITLQGGMMGGGKLSGVGGISGMATPGMDGQAAWAIDGMSMTGDGQAGMPPLFTIQRGRSVVLTIRNETAWWHPMHFHGHSLKILTRNGSPVPHRQWNDTILFAPKDIVECAFVADNPGDWMLHCHVMDHQMAGLMTVLRIA
ncbi:multicopper oxidase family protein [Rhizobium sp. LC145]|uniref:multicopper oxidase family protein n=1 Tax=Rhizobium sp. LC145 TaxID=1120688 RepID=UPI000629E83B|nr:multicopper oxidase family protein [Rhizobium sp. LC145]KKX29450.1 copper oxidase [Rhizobium sp. LC145]MDX3927993.1 multicopper oxidase family protein [Shinella sp.]TKT66171.1 multicopper oxidase family protein [Rhizobiaceae bacterium LC148]